MSESIRKDVNNVFRIRKSKNDTIKEKLETYFKHRNYINNKFRKSDLLLLQSKKQFFYSKIMENEISKVNSYLYSNALCFNNNFNMLDQQFSNFLAFIESKEEPFKTEFQNLLGPLICHIYIDLIKCKEFKIGREFLKKYRCIILVDDEFNENKLRKTDYSITHENSGDLIKEHFKYLLKILFSCVTIDDIEANETLVLFRNAKYELYFSAESLKLLADFFEKQGHVIILNIFQSWFNFEVKEHKGIEKFEDIDCWRSSSNYVDFKTVNATKSEKYLLRTASPVIKHDCLDKCNKKSNIYLRRIKHAANKFQNIEQPTHHFVIANIESNLTCSSLDSYKCHIVAGYESSLIKLWRMNQDVPFGRNLYSKPVNRICNWTYDEEFELRNSNNDFYLSNQSIFKPQFFRGHTGGITDVQFSKKYAAIFSTSKDKTLRLWETFGQGKESRKYEGHNYAIWCLSESPLHSYVATGSKDLTAKLWSLHRKSPLISYVGHTEDVQTIAFHPNANYVATGSSDCSVRLWSVSTGRLFRIFSDCKYSISNVTFSPEGKYLAASEGNIVRIFDLAAGMQITELKDHSSRITDICWNSNGKLLGSVCSDGTIRLWDAFKSDIKNQKNVHKLLSFMKTDHKVIKIGFNSLDMLSFVVANND